MNRRQVLKNSLILGTGMMLPNIKVKSKIDSKLIDEIRAHKKGIAVWWVGHNGWLIKSDDILVGTDLPLETKAREVPSPVTAKELAGERIFPSSPMNIAIILKGKLPEFFLKMGTAFLLCPQVVLKLQ